MGHVHVAHMGGMKNANKILVWEPERERSLGRTRDRCEHNITMDLEEMVWKV